MAEIGLNFAANIILAQDMFFFARCSGDPSFVLTAFARLGAEKGGRGVIPMLPRQIRGRRIMIA